VEWRRSSGGRKGLTGEKMGGIKRFLQADDAHLSMAFGTDEGACFIRLSTGITPWLVLAIVPPVQIILLNGTDSP